MNKLNILFILLIIILLTSCTFNVSMAHTQGRAKDTIDTTQEPSPKVDADLNIPLNPPYNLKI